MDPFIGEIRAVAFNYAPMDWAICAGQQIQITQNQALYALLGTTFGGNGTTYFNLPDLRGRCAIGQGQGLGLSSRILGQTGGSENKQLQIANMPSHNHTAVVAGSASAVFKMSSDVADSDDPADAMFGKLKSGPTTFQKLYDKTPSTVITMSQDSVSIDTSKLTASISNTGLGTGFDIMSPFLALNYIIATAGIWPSRP